MRYTNAFDVLNNARVFNYFLKNPQPTITLDVMNIRCYELYNTIP